MSEAVLRQGGSRLQVDLATSRTPRAFRGDDNFWRPDLERIFGLIDRHRAVVEEYKKLSKRDSGQRLPPPHLSIAIFGPSGSGKSSLLRTLEDVIGNDEKHKILPESCKEKVIALPTMDPTSWRRTDQFLYAFLASCLEYEAENAKGEGNYSQGLTQLQLAFQGVNEYLQVVDDFGVSEEHDPLGLSLQKLERHTSSLRLHAALGRFISALADTFSATLIILPVDDLDMAPDHLVDSLQTFQSFLVHPQLVPVFAFTDRMPEEIIEAHYDAKLAAAEATRRAELGGDRLSISQQLAVQFLSRCFPVRNRIRLGPAPARVQRAVFKSSKNAGEQQAETYEPAVLELLTTASFLLFGHPDQEDAHKVRAALRPSTLRRMMQVVDAIAECRVETLFSPQLAAMVAPRSIGKEFAKELGLISGNETYKWLDWYQEVLEPAKPWLSQTWHPKQTHILDQHDPAYPKQARGHAYLVLARRLRNLGTDATWASIFNTACWSLLNVHRDTLRELTLYLEDLYSWTPKVLRSVILDKILEKPKEVRLTVVDRWLNRTDLRRSQVLSLLAANTFRPWMRGEEPYGDDETSIQLAIVQDQGAPKLDQADLERGSTEVIGQQIRDRLSFSAVQGVVWFTNVLLGFYLPQVLARDWNEALSGDESVRSRMDGNGWDLRHAPVNAVRIADARHEAYSFGTMFLDPKGFRRALDAVKLKHGKLQRKKDETDQEFEDRNKLKQRRIAAWAGTNPTWRGHLLLRLWCSIGYSRGRYWSAFSLWRGLSFIAQVLEAGERHHDLLENKSADCTPLHIAIKGIIRSHCLNGLSPGSLLDRGAGDHRLLHGFPKWDPDDTTIRDASATTSSKTGAAPKSAPEEDPETLKGAILALAMELTDWLRTCIADRIFPMPAGRVWIGWRDCFMRRIHGEYILGSLWPRLNSAYLEEQTRYDCRFLAKRRAFSDERLVEAEATPPPRSEESFRWTAAVAAGAWSDILLEYWRGCLPVLRILITCPAFWKSRQRWGDAEGTVAFTKVLAALKEQNEKGELPSVKRKGASQKESKKPLYDALNGEEQHRFRWLARLANNGEFWKSLDFESRTVPGLSTDELCIERVDAEGFASPAPQHHSVELRPLRISHDRRKKDDYLVHQEPEFYPPLPESDAEKGAASAPPAPAAPPARK